MRTSFLIGVAAFILAFSALPSHAGGKKSDAEVKVTAKGAKPDASGKQVVTISLVHNKGWHSYANPVGNEDFENAQTEVKITAKTKPEKVKIEYPEGKLHKDKVVGDYKIYEDKVEIKAVVQRAAGDSGPLEVSVRFMACHEKGVCLLPATVKLKVE
ncbi:MAG: protein-disulfide reductase DsbD N-terminal domain-containing protein [Gemmataceae bacterium]|nr:protein-disulfide reductase DsbD N-terminal domain-containing protein [Gemmataceae bacterium]MCI0739945.1 protein-disulfide reductase DsbD N-terminal domain-containing protein [Gemmataceae bacterium]